LPHDEAAQREHLREVDEDLRRDQEADRVAKNYSPVGTGGPGISSSLLVRPDSS
jgi:hypothetical protein